MEPTTPPATQQQVIDRLKTATNILVTVSNSPSVDQLAATVGITLALNKIGKHATAVFSGDIPSTIDFLKPEATLEKNTDSLRDFIVSLDKSKADKLRYKVEENIVKIFITPYRTSLSEKDLEFSQGDFNVDVVLALGVSEQGQLDQAITAHGRILHDATVVTVSAGSATSALGALNWSDPTASSLSEMLALVAEGLGENLYDAQIATALLTGVVAETERFSNEKTNPKVMALASRLMTAGANQQLIATELEEPEMTEDKEVSIDQKDKSLSIAHGEDKPVESKPEEKEAEKAESPAELPEPVEEPKVEEAEPVKTAEVSTEDKPEPAKESPIEPINLEAIKAAPEPEQPDESHEIEIDEHGTLTIARNKPTGRMVEPKAENAEPGHGFSANMKDEDESNAVNADPLTTVSADSASLVPFQTTQPEPLLTHSSFTPSPSVTPPQPTSQPPMADSGFMSSAPQPSAPSPAPEPQAPPAADVNAARDAVNSAINSAPYDTSRPEPLQALNAAPISLDQPPAPPVVDSPPQTPNTESGPDLPEAPPVPPPMLPFNPKS